MQKAMLAERYPRVRAQSLSWLAHLSAEDCGAQAMPDASPLKWHLAHTNWFFETLVLPQQVDGFQPWNPSFRALFNSYYQQLSVPYPRARRGLLTRPSLDEVLAWRAQVDAQMQDSLIRSAGDSQLAALIELGIQHEQQHQELIATDILCLFAANPLRPAVLPAVLPTAVAASPDRRAADWVRFSETKTRIGHRGTGFCFDNELPSPVQYLPAYALSSALVSNAEYLAFVESGAYAQPRWWMAEGWDWLRAEDRRHPLYWHRDARGQWHEFSLHGDQPLRPDGAVAHLSLYEADAYARWTGNRLPTEAEWEHAARSAQQDFHDLFGCCWQWTQSSYAPYPGFRTAEGAIGEYNGKFMLNQYVLRGSSSLTPAGHARISYRNFFPAHACWQRAGIRLAKDAG